MHTHHLVPVSLFAGARIFSFDFNLFWGIVSLGQTQAAYPSVNGAATSTPHAKKWTISCRAGQICKTSPAKGPSRSSFAQWVWPQLRLQAQPVSRAVCACKGTGTYRAGRAQGAKTPQPALFHTPRLSAPQLCDSSQSGASQMNAAPQKGALC